MDTETLIIGGGLSGLSLARHLSARGDRFLLVEPLGWPHIQRNPRRRRL
ncbi:FAD-dependent monooxygenase [Phaeobacter italicus]|nr:FAD-dependent monooxygenase [Phaeobacter italicus]